MFGPYYSPPSYTGVPRCYKGVWYTVHATGMISLRLATGAEVCFTDEKGVKVCIDQNIDAYEAAKVYGKPCS